MLKIKVQNLPGIYSIYCEENNSVYIGSSIDVNKRLKRHLTNLRKNIHDNIKLQRIFNKYKENSFSFTVLEYCDKNDNILLQKELYWYNISKAKFDIINLVSIERNTLPNELLNLSRRGKRNSKANLVATGYSKTYNNKYAVRCSYNKIEVYFGTYDTEEEAKQIYQQVIKISEIEDALKYAKKLKDNLRTNRNRHFYGTKKRRDKFECWISLNKKRIYLGIFNLETEAAKAYNEYIIKNKLDKKLNEL